MHCHMKEGLDTFNHVESSETYGHGEVGSLTYSHEEDGSHAYSLLQPSGLQFGHL